MDDRNVTWHGAAITRAARWQALGASGGTLWLTGLSGAGKSTIAAEVERCLVQCGVRAYRLDGDNLRLGLNRDLGFSPESRAENLRRVTEVAALFADSGAVCIAATISPLKVHRESARKRHEDMGLPFFEVFVSTPIAVCRERDPKGLYARAERGEVADFTGVSAPYEAPAAPDLTLPAHRLSVEDATRACVTFSVEHGLAPEAIIGSFPPPRTHG